MMITSGCNVTLWPRVRFQHRFEAGPCFFRLPNRPPAGGGGDQQQHWWIEIAFSSFQMGRSVLNQSCPTGHLKVRIPYPAQPNRNDYLITFFDYMTTGCCCCCCVTVCRRNGRSGKFFRNFLRAAERRFANLSDPGQEFDPLRPSRFGAGPL